MSAAARDGFFSLLHAEHLKPRGYRKVRHTFSRQFAEYCGHYQLQGSSWNAEASDWRFYVNCGISFDGIPQREPDRDFPHVHAWSRAPHFVQVALAHYDVNEQNAASVASEVAAVIDGCADYFSRRHTFLLDAYMRRDYKWPFLRDPELEALRGAVQPPNKSLERMREG